MEEIKHLYGCLPSPPDERDYQAKDYLAMGVRPKSYIPAVTAPVHCQEYDDCTAFALAAAKFYHEERERKSQAEFSPLYSFFDREESDWQGEGRYLREVLNAAKKRGIARVCDIPQGMPYEAKYPNRGISNVLSTVRDKAAGFKIAAYARAADLDEAAECIYQHGAALISLPVRVSFDAFVLKKESEMVLPVPKETERIRGYHAVCAMGYTEDGVIIQNSWGEAWGAKGFAILPWDYPITEVWTMIDEKKKWDLIELPIKAEYAKVNGKDVPLDVPAQILNGRTMVPIRFIAEALGCEVEWLAKEKTVVIRREVK